MQNKYTSVDCLTKIRLKIGLKYLKKFTLSNNILILYYLSF